MNHFFVPLFLIFLCISRGVICDGDDDGEVDETPAEAAREEKIECVNSCGDTTVEQWKICAPKCYDEGKMGDDDRKFISCEGDCLDKFYPPHVEEPLLDDLGICVEKCIQAYRGF